MTRRSGQRGLTLVELLAALAVLAVLATLSVRGITALVATETRARAEVAQWQALARLAEQMQHDFSLALGTPVLDAQGALLVRRRSDADRASDDSRPRNVAFRLQGERLEYLRWSRAGGSIPETSVVLEKVRSLEWRALGEDGVWRPLEASKDAPPAPRAMEARLTFAGGAQVNRVFALQ
ncbi:MAG TPA: type II secretion system protein GspJ [Burkholderiales bacterium]|nr:type II secretion system protein GspJ [Burkholderiales bacterium]